MCIVMMKDSNFPMQHTHHMQLMSYQLEYYDVEYELVGPMPVFPTEKTEVICISHFKFQKVLIYFLHVQFTSICCKGYCPVNIAFFVMKLCCPIIFW